MAKLALGVSLKRLKQGGRVPSVLFNWGSDVGSSAVVGKDDLMFCAVVVVEWDI